MKYIHHVLPVGAGILEVGAGTGRYSLALTREGYRVDAVELVQHNLDILTQNIQPGDSISAIPGDALDLSIYADKTFDVTLLLGPMYLDFHLSICERQDLIGASHHALDILKRLYGVSGAIAMQHYTPREYTEGAIM